MNVNEIQSTDDILKFIEGCFNDFETGVSSKNESIGNIVDLIAYLNAKANDTNRDSKHHAAG